MGYMSVWSNCIVCKQLFPYNPFEVPSLRVDGVKEPVCGGCMETINKLRVKKGVEPFHVSKEAYEPVHENDARWED